MWWFPDIEILVRRWTVRGGAMLHRLTLAASLMAVTPMAKADTLTDALAAAYRNNPKLEAARASQRATDEEVPRAMSGFRPTVSGSADTGRQRAINTDTTPTTTTAFSRPQGYGIQAVQSVYSGGRTVNAVNEAEANVRAGREALRTTEQTLLLDVVTAYMDAFRDQAVAKSREIYVEGLTREVRYAQSRVKATEATGTDLAQTEARRAGAASALSAARANASVSRSTLQRHTGVVPGLLLDPKQTDEQLPRLLSEALDIAKREHPAVGGALYREQAARFAIDRIRAELLPSLQVEANYTRRLEPSQQLEATNTASVIGRLSVPLYSGGEVEARVRQAKHTHVARLQEIEQNRQEVHNSVEAAWAQLRAARAQTLTDAEQLLAARTALAGTRQEERVGQRTILDTLNAEQETLSAEVTLAGTRRNLVVAAFTLRAAIGRLTMGAIGTAPALYDPERHANEVRRQWGGVSIAGPATPQLLDDGASPLGAASPGRPPRYLREVPEPTITTAPLPSRKMVPQEGHWSTEVHPSIR
jgi:outer membrane protein